MNDTNKPSPNNRISALTKTGESVFRDNDLATIWGIVDKNTLYTTIKRYCAKNILIRIKSGVYSLVNPKNIIPETIGAKILHKYCYVSTETVLRDAGVILQNIQHLTFISNISKRFSAEIIGQSYISRKLKDEFLYNMSGIYEKDGIKYATIERAVADIQYFNPLYYFDNASDKIINWKEVRRIQKEIGYK